MNKLIKLAFYQSLIELKAQWKSRRWFILLYLVCMGFVTAGGLLDDSKTTAFWIVYLVTVIIGEFFRTQENFFPRIFSYVPMDNRQKKKYLICRISVGSMLLMSGLLIFLVVELIRGTLLRDGHLLLPLGWCYMILLIQMQQVIAVVQEMGRQMDETIIRQPLRRLMISKILGFILVFPAVFMIFVLPEDGHVKLFMVMLMAGIAATAFTVGYHTRFIWKYFEQVQWR